MHQNSKKFEQLYHSRSLKELKDRTETLREMLNRGEISLLEEDLKKIFTELKVHLQSKNISLTKGIQIMESGTELLDNKIDELTTLISILTREDHVIEFLESFESDTDLKRILNTFWRDPIRLPQFSLGFLKKSYERLVTNKPQRQSNVLDLMKEDFDEKPINVVENNEFEFQHQIEQYLYSIQNKFPNTLEQILEDDTEGDEYFDHFSYILHLLQNNYLIFDKKTKIFHLTEKLHLITPNESKGTENNE